MKKGDKVLTGGSIHVRSDDLPVLAFRQIFSPPSRLFQHLPLLCG
jgi:hypothetical protein